MINFFQEVFIWWFVIFTIGLFTLPFTLNLFSKFFDAGYIFSKIIGIIVISYLLYIGGTLHLFPFTTISAYSVLTAYAFLSIGIAIKTKKYFFIKKYFHIFILEELIFFAGVLFWAYIKGFQPDIHGLEKFMDYGFINSILRTTYFPAKDMWMTPLSINYYYFGHIMTAVLTKISFLPSKVTFNLMLATIFSFTFSEGFSLGANFIFMLRRELKQKVHILPVIFSGLVTAMLLTIGGNLHTIYTFFTPYSNDSPVPITQLIFSPVTFPNQYWYPNATRFIFHTIHEFPIYSFVVSDLHGHVLDIPAVLLTIAGLFLFIQTSFLNAKKLFLSIILLGSIAGIMYMTNAWDGLIYIGVISIALFYKLYKSSVWQTLFRKELAISYILLVANFIIISLPFSLFFKPFASEIGINCAPPFLLYLQKFGPFVFEQGYCQTSPLWQLAVLYGFFFFWLVSFGAFLIQEFKKTKQIVAVDYFVLAMGILGFVLIIIPEFVYLKDIYTTYFRANTMFKLVYQAFILLSLVSGYTIYRIFSTAKSTKKNILKKIFFSLYSIISIALISLVMIYPYFAIFSYFNGLKNFQGIDGTTYLKQINKDDYQAVLWINTHISDQPIMLEAQGDSYTDYERISANTGLPTVFGWMVHEWLWRGTYDVVPQRVADVKELYESKSLDITRALLNKYHVTYVYIGDMERTKYPEVYEKKFTTLGKDIYSSGSVKIYKITTD